MIYRFQAEVLTPLVIAGADNRTLMAEGLRPPSLRGAMRWWFRALMGSVVSNAMRYQDLKTAEARIFGATGVASPVRLRTYPLCDLKIGSAYLCMNDSSNRKPAGKRYPYARIQRSALQPPSQFRLRFRCSNGAGASETAEGALTALWLLGKFGGVGARSRRGFGSLEVVPQDEPPAQVLQGLGLSFEYPDRSLAEIAGALVQQLEAARRLFEIHAQTMNLRSCPHPEQAGFTVLSTQMTKLFLLHPPSGLWSSWQTAMNDLRERIYRPFKRYLGISEIGCARPRWASPLLLQIKRRVDGRYFGVLLAFRDSQCRSFQYWGPNWEALKGFLKATGYVYEEVSLP